MISLCDDISQICLNRLKSSTSCGRVVMTTCRSCDTASRTRQRSFRYWAMSYTIVYPCSLLTNSIALCRECGCSIVSLDTSDTSLEQLRACGRTRHGHVALRGPTPEEPRIAQSGSGQITPCPPGANDLTVESLL